MPKEFHEIRDPVHAFIRLDTQERTVVDSFPYQRLRHIHQLTLSHLVYPGATHTRFEHCLGVMELAGRVFDVITHPEKLRRLPEQTSRSIPVVEDERRYWRRVVRMAGLCHDLGHLPFSHVAEGELLPEGWDHERISIAIILSEEMQPIWANMRPPLNPQHIAMLAVGPKKLRHLQAQGINLEFDDWEALLSEIIVGDAFGVDRMDYLLRDSYHAGVPLGKFDHLRLIDTLRILPKTIGGSEEPVLGVEAGGLHAAESLLLARYFMFITVYLHPVRRIYDIHLKDFLKAWLPKGKFSTDLQDHLNLMDNAIMVEIYGAARDPGRAHHPLARRLVLREHFKEVYRRIPEDLRLCLEPGKAIFEALRGRYGEDLVRHDHYDRVDAPPEFPVLTRDGRITSSLELSAPIRQIPIVSVDSVFVDPGIRQEAIEWINAERNTILKQAAGPEEE